MSITKLYPFILLRISDCFISRIFPVGDDCALRKLCWSSFMKIGRQMTVSNSFLRNFYRNSIGRFFRFRSGASRVKKRDFFHLRSDWLKLIGNLLILSSFFFLFNGVMTSLIFLECSTFIFRNFQNAIFSSELLDESFIHPYAFWNVLSRHCRNRLSLKLKFR